MTLLLSREASEHFSTEAPVTAVHKRTPPVNFRQGMHNVCRVHRDAAVHDRKRKEEDLEAANAFLADTTSQWCRIVPNSMRGRR